MTRNRGLDCMRALAIMLVVLGHTVNSFGSPAHLVPLQFGGSGVDLFFVLSGWLIGSQIFKEYQDFQTFEIKRFWVRRWMRTFPAYYAVLVVSITHQVISKADFTFPVAHIFFLQNYQEQLNFFFISWSLCVEEQFYLFIAPFIALITLVSRRYQLFCLLVLLFLPSVFRELGWFITTRETHVRIDCCVVGVLLALLKYRFDFLWSLLKRHSSVLFVVGVLGYVFCYVNRYNPGWGIADPSYLILGLMFATWVVKAEKKQVELNRYLDKLVMHISTRSYSMYLLHVDALVVTKKLFDGLPFVLYFAVATIITLGASELLYRFVEVPLINKRESISFARRRVMA